MPHDFFPRPAPAPYQLLAHLPAQVEVRLLQARGPGGWRSSPSGTAPNTGLNILACEPEARFLGGLPELRAALRWLDAGPGREPTDRLLIGSLAYELGAAFESRAPGAAAGLPPPVDLAGFRAAYVWDPCSGTARVVGEDAMAREHLAQRVAAACARSAREMPEPRRLPTPRASLDAAGYRAGVEAIRRWIRAGDVYQVNLSRRLSWPRLGRPELRALFGRITAGAGAPFDAYLEGPQRTVISNSPERFLHVAAGQVETCPIKGTRPRGRTPTEDRWQAKALRGSAKDAAEHLMIVDLERNDLGRVCELGSVRVQELAALRSFPTVHHLVSSVQGRLRRDVDLETLLAATFPGGSITGAPKLRAMQIIDALEPVPRDVYTGAIGYLDAAGGMDWSIAIRTAIARDDGLHLHVGGGIVADSDPEAELRETRDKARAFADLWGWDA